MPLNTDQLKTGEHQVQIFVDDAAGDSDAVWSGTIKVKRAHIPNGTVCAGPRLSVTVNGRHRRVSVPFGRRVRLEGYLHCAGFAIRRATVLIAGGGLAADVRTGKHGRFSFLVPSGPNRSLSRQLHGLQRRRESGRDREGEIAVRPRIALAISPTRTANHQTIDWSGSIASGPYPRGGVALLVQVREGDRWVTFDQIVASEGRFAYQYTFARTDQPTSYLFRVSLPHGGAAGYPYTWGASAPIRVYVH